MPTSKKTPKNGIYGNSAAPVKAVKTTTNQSRSSNTNNTTNGGNYVKGWATKGHLPRLWRNRIQEAMVPSPSSPLPAVLTSSADHYTSLKAFIETQYNPLPHGYKATLEELQNNIHTHPLLHIASAFNPITLDLKSGKEVDLQRVLDVFEMIGNQHEGLDDQRQRLNTMYACQYIQDMIHLLESQASREEQYIAWYYALLHFKRTGDKYDQYFINMPSPDEVFGGLDIH